MLPPVATSKKCSSRACAGPDLWLCAFLSYALALAFIVVSGAWAQSSTAPETDEPLDDSLRVEIVDEAFTGLSILQGGGELLSNTSVVKLDDLYWLWLIQHEFNIDEEYILPVSGRIDLPEGQYIADSYTGSFQIDAISQNCDRRNLTTYDEFAALLRWLVRLDDRKFKNIIPNSWFKTKKSCQQSRCTDK